ncbi:MAG: type II toxin-antitoxin system RelE/ParE family toxin [bacterium]
MLYTPQARADLRDISRFTDARWGREQRMGYLGRLKNRFPQLANHPQTGRKRYEIVGAPYSFHEGRHVIFYQEIEDGIEVLRLLHDAMDFPRHF